MNMRGWLVLSVALALVISSFFGCTSPSPISAPSTTPSPEPEAIVVKAVSWTIGEGTVAFKRIVDLVNERSKGKLKINWLGGPEVIAAVDQPSSLKTGMVDIGVFPASQYWGLVPEANVLHMRQLKPWELRNNGYFDLLQEAHKKAGFYILGWGKVLDGANNNYTKSRVDKPGDFKGRKFRGAGTYASFQTALGIVGVTIVPAEVYNAMQSGLVEGVTWTDDGIVQFKLVEAGIKYVIDHPFYADNAMILMSLNSFNKLSGDQQKLLTDIMKETDRWSSDYFDKQQSEYRKQLLAQGLQEIKFSPEDAKAYVNLAYSSAWEQIIKTCPATGPRLRELSSK